MTVVVFWLDSYMSDSLAPGKVVESDFKSFEDSDFMNAMKFAEEKRKAGKDHVTISTQLSDSVGKAGVSSVENGKTPDGVDYEWSKQHRGGPGR
jgi:hypothetical protein